MCVLVRLACRRGQHRRQRCCRAHPLARPLQPQEDFRPLVRASEGFEWRPQKPSAASFVEQKWGWAGQDPGARVWGCRYRQPVQAAEQRVVDC